MTQQWTAAYLQREWPTLEPIPEGRDVFAPAPIYHPQPRSCPQCHGYGKAVGPNGEWRDCPTCHGRGTTK